jgi:hypothetical protein
VRARFLAWALALLASGLLGAFALGRWVMNSNPTETLAASLLAQGQTPQVGVARLRQIDGVPGTEWLSSGIARYLATQLGEQAQADTRVLDALELSVDSARGSAAGSEGKPLPGQPLPRSSTGSTLIFGSYSVDVEREVIAGELRISDDLEERRIPFSSTLSNLGPALDRASERVAEELGLETKSKRNVAANRESLGAAALEELRKLNHPAAKWLFQQTESLDTDPALSGHFARTLWRLGEGDEARRQLLSAQEQGSRLGREQELVIAATRSEIEGLPKQVERSWAALFEFFPENRLYGSELVLAQIEITNWDEARHTLARLASNDQVGDPLVDLLAARLAGATADSVEYLEAARASLENARGSDELGLIAAAHLELARALDLSADPQAAYQEADRAIALYERLGDFQAAQQARTISRFLEAAALKSVADTPPPR